MYKITSIFSKEWHDYVGFILQAPRRNEFFVSVPVRYKDVLGIAIQHPTSNSLSVTTSGGYYTASCTAVGGIHEVTLKGGLVCIRPNRLQEKDGFLVLDVIPEAEDMYIIGHDFTPTETVPNAIEAVLNVRPKREDIPRKDQPEPTAIKSANIEYVLDLLKEAGIFFEGEGVPTRETLITALGTLRGNCANYLDYYSKDWEGAFNLNGELVTTDSE